MKVAAIALSAVIATGHVVHAMESTSINAELLSNKNGTISLIPSRPPTQGPMNTTLTVRYVDDMAPAEIRYAPATRQVVYHGGRILNGVTPVYIIYYGTSNTFNLNHKTIIQDFITHLSANSYWSIVKSYVTPYFRQSNNGLTVAGAIELNCNTIAQGCLLDHFAVENITANLLSTRRLPSNPNAIYLFIAQSSIKQQFSTSMKVAGKDYCGYHGYFTSRLTQYPIIFAPIPNKFPGGTNTQASVCFTKNTIKSPNNDVELDSFISVLTHELVETVLSPIPMTGWSDRISRVEEVMDMCQQYYLRVMHENGYAYNFQVGSRRFLLPPIVEPRTSQCVPN